MNDFKHEAWATAVTAVSLALIVAYTYLRLKGVSVP